MTVTRDVILDLLPLYLADEASQDTRVLVEKFLEQDRELARLVEETPDRLLSAKIPVPLTEEHELKTLKRTKTMMKLRSVLLGCAIFFSTAPFTAYFPSAGDRWLLMEKLPALAIVFAIVGMSAWIGYFTVGRMLR
ncbi:MAG: hypothetical protein HYV63_03335 [Candidatus Schekmanbacteria bacterium]|nr:hypothetical protein [Candidatus Schekmanbacteria bacterium]